MCEAEWLCELFSLFGPPVDCSVQLPSVLEPACGSGRLLHALLARGYSCTGFDRQPAAVQFAQSRCEAALRDSAAMRGRVGAASMGSSAIRAGPASPLTALPAPLPAFCVFEASLDSFMSCQPPPLPPRSVHMAHCLVSSLKYLLSEQAMLAHFAAVAACLVDGGLYVFALHVCDYSDDSCSVDEHTAERDGVSVVATITCEPPNKQQRTERVHIKMAVTTAVVAEERDTAASVDHYCWEETMRTYDRLEVWQLLTAVCARWFELVATFDYEQARRGAVEAPLEWPQQLHTLDANTATPLGAVQPSLASVDWTGWEGVEALAIVLQRKHSLTLTADTTHTEL